MHYTLFGFLRSSFITRAPRKWAQSSNMKKKIQILTRNTLSLKIDKIDLIQEPIRKEEGVIVLLSIMIQSSISQYMYFLKKNLWWLKVRTLTLKEWIHMKGKVKKEIWWNQTTSIEQVMSLVENLINGS